MRVRWPRARSLGVCWHDRDKPRRTLDTWAPKSPRRRRRGARRLRAERARTMARRAETSAAVRDEYDRALAIRAIAASRSRPRGRVGRRGAREAPRARGDGVRRKATRSSRRGSTSSEADCSTPRARTQRPRTRCARRSRSTEGLGPVRDAAVRRAVVKNDARTRRSARSGGGARKGSGARGRAQCDAACIARLASGDAARSIALLCSRRGTRPRGPLARRIADALVESHEEKQDWAAARRPAHARAALHATPDERAMELRASSLVAERAGDAKGTLSRIRGRARAQSRGRAHDVAARSDCSPAAARDAVAFATRHVRGRRGARTALLRAADLAHEGGRCGAGGRVSAGRERGDAGRSRRGRASRGGAAGCARSRGRRSRACVLYERAAERAEDDAARVAWLERLALVYEEIAGDVAAARRAWDAVRAIDPERRERDPRRAARRDALGRPRGARERAAGRSEALDKARAARLRLRAARALAASDPIERSSCAKTATGSRSRRRSTRAPGDGPRSPPSSRHACARRRRTTREGLAPRRARGNPSHAPRRGGRRARLASFGARARGRRRFLGRDRRARGGAHGSGAAPRRARRACANRDERGRGGAPVGSRRRAVRARPGRRRARREVVRARARSGAGRRVARDPARTGSCEARACTRRGPRGARRGARREPHVDSGPARRSQRSRRARTRRRSSRTRSKRKSRPSRAISRGSSRFGKRPRSSIGACRRAGPTTSTSASSRWGPIAPRSMRCCAARCRPAREDEKARDAALRALDGLVAFAPDVSSRLALLLMGAALFDARGDQAGALARYKQALSVESAFTDGRDARRAARRDPARQRGDGRRVVRARRHRDRRAVARSAARSRGRHARREE